MPEEKKIRLVLRHPEAVDQVADLAAIPHAFDHLFNKPYYAHQLRLAGYDWFQVAHKLDYSSPYYAEKAVYHWLRKTAEDSKDLSRTKEQLRQESVQQELARLDRLQATYWQDAIEGDIPSATFVLRVIQQRAKLLGLEQTVNAEIVNQVNTLVVGGDEASYVGALMRARDSLGPMLGPATNTVIDSDDQPVVVD